METGPMTQADTLRDLTRRIRALIRLVGQPEAFTAEADDVAAALESRRKMGDTADYIGPTPERLAKAGEDVEAFIADNNRPTLERLATRRKITGASTTRVAAISPMAMHASGVVDLAAERSIVRPRLIYPTIASPLKRASPARQRALRSLFF